MNVSYERTVDLLTIELIMSKSMTVLNSIEPEVNRIYKTENMWPQMRLTAVIIGLVNSYSYYFKRYFQYFSTLVGPCT